MTLSTNQLHQLLELLEKQLSVFVGSTLGPEYLTDQQKATLTASGVDVAGLYKVTNDPVLLNFHLGQLSDLLGQQAVANMMFQQLKHYVASGQHLPLSARERATINSIKHQALSDIRAHQGQIFQDVNRVVQLGGRHEQEEFLREQILSGISKRESVKQISQELAKLTGDWTRNFYKAVQYVSHTALNEGRLALVQQRYEDPGAAKVYFIVQPDACEHCVRCYLDHGVPRLFTIRELLQNGTNIGRKAKDYLPTVGPIHVHCRCLLTEYKEGTKWDGHTFVQDHQLVYHPTVTRKKVKVVINGQEHLV